MQIQADNGIILGELRTANTTMKVPPFGNVPAVEVTWSADDGEPEQKVLLPVQALERLVFEAGGRIPGIRVVRCDTGRTDRR